MVGLSREWSGFLLEWSDWNGRVFLRMFGSALAMVALSFDVVALAFDVVGYALHHLFLLAFNTYLSCLELGLLPSQRLDETDSRLMCKCDGSSIGRVLSSMVALIQTSFCAKSKFERAEHYLRKARAPDLYRNYGRASHRYMERERERERET
ncbi:hypothetical protein E4T42_05349 [Aureobasidium subglaciale]|nr:hypothetical protein E4T42_05349 [Aureobasidium subglaciale]